jgi:hypothetical protein
VLHFRLLLLLLLPLLLLMLLSREDFRTNQAVVNKDQPQDTLFVLLRRLC